MLERPAVLHTDALTNIPLRRASCIWQILNFVVFALRWSGHAARGVLMGYREFIDSLSTVWKVWNTVPLAGAVLHGELKDGWLTFESVAACLRRLAPVPANWEQLSAEQLERLCGQAAEVRRLTPIGGVAVHNEEQP